MTDPVRTTPACCAETPELLCEQHKQAQRVMRFSGPRNRTGRASAVVGESGKAKPAPSKENEQ